MNCNISAICDPTCLNDGDFFDATFFNIILLLILHSRILVFTMFTEDHLNVTISAICNPTCLNGGVCTEPGGICDCSLTIGYTAGDDCNSREYG